LPRVRLRQRCFHVRPRGSRRHRSLIRSIIRSCTVLGGGEVPGRLNGAASKSSISPKGDRQFGSLFLLRRVSLQTTTPSRERPMVRIPLPAQHRLSPERIQIYISSRIARLLEFRTSVSSIRWVPFEGIACLRASIPASTPSLGSTGGSRRPNRGAVALIGAYR